MKIVVIDNFDSFTYNLVHIIEQYSHEIKVMRNNEIDWMTLEKSDKIIFSPGPGLPKESGSMGEILNQFSDSKPILGVCLGMQYIGEYFGAELINLPEIVHGIPKKTMISSPIDPIFKGIPCEFESGRYHSWALSRKNFPECIRITATDEQNTIMAIRHKNFNLCGVQFHPESIMTQFGKNILSNWILE